MEDIQRFAVNSIKYNSSLRSSSDTYRNVSHQFIYRGYGVDSMKMFICVFYLVLIFIFIRFQLSLLCILYVFLAVASDTLEHTINLFL